MMRSQPSAEDLPERPKVLLVDDDEVNLLLTSVALQEQGFGVTEAVSGEQAIGILGTHGGLHVVGDAFFEHESFLHEREG